MGKTELSRVRVNGVRMAYEKYKNISESKGVRAHFHLDESCLLVIDRVKIIFNILSNKSSIHFRLNIFMVKPTMIPMTMRSIIKKKNLHYQVNLID